MILYPAIDLRNGKVVRLQEGDPNRQTIFSDAPIDTAHRWIEQGASWLHVVNLDGAFGDASPNLRILAELTKLGVKVQFGGGLRTTEDIQRVIELGVERVVLGTIALKQPQVVIDTVDRFGSARVCVALDTKDGMVTTHGWQTVSDLSAVSVGQEMAKNGVRHALYTDVSRDGKLSGVNVHDTVNLHKQTGLDVIASGGVSSLSDIETLYKTQQVAGAIIGMALYTEQFTLSDALKITG